MRRSANAVIARMDMIFQAGKRSMMVQNLARLWGAAKADCPGFLLVAG